MAKVVPIKSVPWLGTRRAGLFRARKLPAKGYPSTTGGPLFAARAMRFILASAGNQNQSPHETRNRHLAGGTLIE